jgi:hypothetical protein
MQGKNLTDIFIIFVILVFSSYHFKYDDNLIKIYFFINFFAPTLEIYIYIYIYIKPNYRILILIYPVTNR